MRAFVFCFLLTLGCFSNLMGQPIDAKHKIVQESIDRFGKNHVNTATAYHNLGLAYFEIRDYQKAIEYYSEALDIQLKISGEKHSNVAISYNCLGRVYYNMNNYKKAINLYDKALSIQLEVSGEKNLHVAIFYNDLGNVYADISNYEKAIFSFKKALNIRLELFGEKHPKVAVSYNNLGTIYSDLGDNEEAIDLYNKALDIQLEIFGKKNSIVATLYNNLGLKYDDVGNYKKAINLQNKALNIRLELFGEKHPKVAISYNNLGLHYYNIGDYEAAITLYKKALSIQLELFGEKHQNIATSYNNLGQLYEALKNYEKAINFQLKALNIQLELFGEKHQSIATSYNNLGGLYYKTKNYKKAIELYEKGLNIQIKALGEKHGDTAALYGNLGTVYNDLGDYRKATDLYNKALTIGIEVFGEKHRGVAVSYGCLGLLYNRLGDNEKAINLLNKALSIQIEVLGEKHPEVTDIYVNLVRIYEETGNRKKANSIWNIIIPQSLEQLKSNYLFLPTEHRIKYSNTLIKNSFNFYSFTFADENYSSKELATDLLLNTKSLALDYAIATNKIIKEINDTGLNTQRKKLNELNKKLAEAEKLTNKELKARKWDLVKIQEKRENIVSQILQHPKLKSKLNTENIKWHDIRGHLNDDEAVISYMRFHEHPNGRCNSLTPNLYYAVVIRKDLSSPQFVRITDEKTLVKLLKADKNERPDYLDKSSGMNALYEALWQPLEPYLESIKTVHISPSGVLHRVPFESLQDMEGEYLAARYEFHYYSALRDMLKEKPQKNTYEDILLMGHILYSPNEKDKYVEEQNNIVFRGETDTRDSIQGLPGTLDEVTEIKHTGKKAGLKTTLLTIDAASEDTVQTFVGKRAPSIIHFATHGVFLPPLEKQHEEHDLIGSRDRLRAADNPLQRSALMLYGANETWTKGRPILGSGEDGILTALEVTALDLQNTNLVVLSACSTGLGNVHNTEGVLGLQRAFKLAGVDYVVASLWDVDDKATKDLMVEFYKNLLERKQDPATALRNAKKYLREEMRYGDPEDWAGFILIE